MRICSVLIAFSAVLAGCLPVSQPGPTTGRLKAKHRVYDAMFADTVENDIKDELKGEQPRKSSTWREHWIRRSEQVFYDLGDSYVEYIIARRRAAGLPDIAEV